MSASSANESRARPRVRTSGRDDMTASLTGRAHGHGGDVSLRGAAEDGGERHDGAHDDRAGSGEGRRADVRGGQRAPGPPPRAAGPRRRPPEPRRGGGGGP